MLALNAIGLWHFRGRVFTTIFRVPAANALLHSGSSQGLDWASLPADRPVKKEAEQRATWKRMPNTTPVAIAMHRSFAAGPAKNRAVGDDDVEVSERDGTSSGTWSRNHCSPSADDDSECKRMWCGTQRWQRSGWCRCVGVDSIDPQNRSYIFARRHLR